MRFVGQMKWSHSKATVIRPRTIQQFYVVFIRNTFSAFHHRRCNVDLLYNANKQSIFVSYLHGVQRAHVISKYFICVLFGAVSSCVGTYNACSYTAIVRRNSFWFNTMRQRFVRTNTEISLCVLCSVYFSLFQKHIHIFRLSLCSLVSLLWGTM